MALSLQSLLAFLVLLTFLASPAVAQRPSEYSRNYTYTRRVYTPTVSTILPSTRFRYECRNVFPIRADIVPHGVVFSGYVEDIKQDTNDEEGYQASVTVRRVFYGPRNLRRSRVTVAGLGGNKTNWCFSNVHRGDSWIFVLQPITYPDYFRLSSSLIKINLANLEKIEGIVADEPYRKMTTVTDQPCETKYCKNNGICLEDKFSSDGTKCECLTYCKKSYAPVCGSNDETYNNECELRLKSCYSNKNWFVKSLTGCQYSRPYFPPAPEPSTTFTSSYRSSSSSLPERNVTSSSSYSYRPVSPLSPYTNPESRESSPTSSRTYTRTHTTHTTVNRYQS